jgi:hypothetical protein
VSLPNDQSGGMAKPSLSKLEGKVYLQTQLSGRLRLVTTKTFPFALAIGIAQHTTRGTARPLVPIVDVIDARRVVMERKLE